MAEICRRAGISEASYFSWKKKYEGLLTAGINSGVGYDQLHHVIASATWGAAPLKKLLLNEADSMVGEPRLWLTLTTRPCRKGASARSGSRSKPKLLGITKRGSKYMRKLAFQGARTALPTLAKTATPLGVWLRGLLARAHGNTVVVALASKLIQIAWALLRNQTMFADSGRATA